MKQINLYLAYKQWACEREVAFRQLLEPLRDVTALLPSGMD